MAWEGSQLAQRTRRGCFGDQRGRTQRGAARLSSTRLRRTWPISTRAETPMGFPKAPRMPVWSLSAPAHVSILLWRSTWKGCTRTRRWKASLPAYCGGATGIEAMNGMRRGTPAGRQIPGREPRLQKSAVLTLTMYLFAATRAASNASDEICSFSHLRARGAASSAACRHELSVRASCERARPRERPACSSGASMPPGIRRPRRRAAPSPRRSPRPRDATAGAEGLEAASADASSGPQHAIGRKKAPGGRVERGAMQVARGTHDTRWQQ